MPKPDHRSQMARAWLHIHAALERTWKQGVQVLRVDWPVYPRRAEHNTVAEGGNRRSAETARLPAKLSGAYALYPASSGGCEPENGFRIGLARPAHRAEPVHHRGIKPHVGAGLLQERQSDVARRVRGEALRCGAGPRRRRCKDEAAGPEDRWCRLRISVRRISVRRSLPW
jgi:hypothetical protein